MLGESSYMYILSRISLVDYATAQSEDMFNIIAWFMVGIGMLYFNLMLHDMPYLLFYMTLSFPVYSSMLSCKCRSVTMS